MLNPCFLVTAYCNTPEKKEVLKQTLQDISKYNIDVILFSHYPIEEDTLELTNHSIYDFSNPMVDFKDRSMIKWVKLNEYVSNPIPYKINTLQVDYGYAAAQQWKRGLTYAYDLGYKEAFILNYDLEVTDKMVDDFKSQLLNYDNIILDYANKKEGKELYMAWHALKLEPFIENIKNINYQDYIQTTEESIVETYLYDKLYSENSLIIPRKEWEGPNRMNPIIKTKIVLEGRLLDQYYRDEGYHWFIGQEKIWLQDDPHIRGTDKMVLFLFNLAKNLEVEMYLGDNLIHKSIVRKQLEYQLIYLPIAFSEIEKYIGKLKNLKYIPSHNGLKIFINGWEIPKELLKLSLISAIEIAYENQ